MYSGKEKRPILSVGWLGLEGEYSTGEVPHAFTKKLKKLCEQSINPYRGFHRCEFCSEEAVSEFSWNKIGNGEIRIKSREGIWYIAPKMIHHYVVEHQYKPPLEFIKCVLDPAKIGKTGDFENYA